MSILDRIRAHGGDLTRNGCRFTLKRGRLSIDALTWLRKPENMRQACREVWPQFDRWEERAAIREYMGGQSREEAERGAYEEVAAC